jgi:hypothetical protein
MVNIEVVADLMELPPTGIVFQIVDERVIPLVVASDA